MGGAGDVGSRTVEDLAFETGIQQITIADWNIHGAQKLASRLRSRGATANVSAVQVDANRHQSLTNCIKGHQIVASALGPFHHYELKLVRAAIEEKAHYTSICDEWEPAKTLFDDFRTWAQRSGTMVITGLGASPGLTNMGVAHLAKSFDQIRKVDVSIYQPLDAGGGEAVFAHMLHIMSGKVATFRGGSAQMIPALSESREVIFPKFGTIKLWNMGHAEPVTIPRFFDVDEVNFFMGYGAGAKSFVWPAQAGLFDKPLAKRWALKLIVALERANRPSNPGIGAIRMDVTGIKDGQEESRLLCGTGQMREATGLSLAVGTAMLARGEVTVSKGDVYAPEGCLDPDAFIKGLSDKGIQAFYDVEMRMPVAGN